MKTNPTTDTKPLKFLTLEELAHYLTRLRKVTKGAVTNVVTYEVDTTVTPNKITIKTK